MHQHYLTAKVCFSQAPTTWVTTSNPVWLKSWSRKLLFQMLHHLKDKRVSNYSFMYISFWHMPKRSQFVLWEMRTWRFRLAQHAAGTSQGNTHGLKPCQPLSSLTSSNMIPVVIFSSPVYTKLYVWHHLAKANWIGSPEIPAPSEWVSECKGVERVVDSNMLLIVWETFVFVSEAQQMWNTT